MPRENHKGLAHELWGVLFLMIGLFLAMSLISYDPADPALNSSSSMSEYNNIMGIAGAWTSDFLYIIFGISAFVIALLFFVASYLQFAGKEIAAKWHQVLAYCIALIALTIVAHLSFGKLSFGTREIGAGGIFGSLGDELTKYLSLTGTYILSLAVLVSSLVYATNISLKKVLKVIIKVTPILAKGLAIIFVSIWRGLRLVGIKTVVLFAYIYKLIMGRIEIWRARRKKHTAKVVTQTPSIAKHQQVVTPPEDKPSPKKDVPKVDPKIYERADGKKAPQKTAQMQMAHIDKDYVYPQLSMLDSPPQNVEAVDHDALKKNSIVLQNKLLDYDVEGRVTEIHPGPVITMYEFEPAPGVKVNKIVNLEDDLSVIVGGRSVRIIPHIPGKAAIGIEVPNHSREIVWLKEILGNQKFEKNASKLTLALGKNTKGEPVITDLAKMPHLLVAGATGSGKSVAINTMIISMLYKTLPSEVKLILIDPKMLELPIYDGVPHLLLPVVTKPRDAVASLAWATREMERRYRLLSDVAVRGITSYNQKIDSGELKLVDKSELPKLKLEKPDGIYHTEKLPFIVIIIDELADLMMVASKEMEEHITRLAQMARAAGIHLILATQRPSVDVITGLIKANFPTRISFKVSSKHDSRVIIDTVGAEKLLGMGDMLFMPPNTSLIQRIHGAFITENEILRVVNHLKEQSEPEYNDEILAPVKDDGTPKLPGEEDAEYDELYDKAVAIVAETKQASISMVQRRLRIGYNRAARMIERMEADGIVGPADGSKPREVFAHNLSANMPEE